MAVQTNRRGWLIVSLFLLTLVSANACANPVSLWKLDEGSGTSACDSIGANHGTLINGTNWGPGVDGNCLEFDGINNYVEVPDDNSLDFAAGQNFSIAFWFRVDRPTHTTTQDILNKRENTSDQIGWHVYYGSRSTKSWYRKVILEIDKGRGSAAITSNTFVDDGRWHHLVVVRQGINYGLYLDGVFQMAYDMPGWDVAWVNSNPLRFGADESLDKFLKGAVDEVAIYRTALSAQEVQQIYEDNIRADAGPNQSYNSIPSLVTLDGRGSFDPNGYSLTYNWQQVLGPAVVLSDPTAAQPTFVPSQFGTYVFKLIVNNGLTDSTPDKVRIIIIENHVPLAYAGIDQQFYFSAIELVTLDGSGSYDPEGKSLTYHWQQIGGPAVVLSDANAVKPTFVPSETDTYSFELVVNDGVYNSIADTVNIVINDTMPVADAGPDQSYSSVPLLVTLDGSGSYDNDGDNLTYRWKQIGGWKVTLSEPNAVSPTFARPMAGIYVFELVVNDGLLDSNPDTVGIVAGGNRAPVADAGLVRYASEPYTPPFYSGIGLDGTVVLDGTGSYDPDGYGALTYQWNQVSGPAVIITNENSATPTISGFTQTSSIQECEFELVVSDGELTSEPDIVKVVVVPVPDFGNPIVSLKNKPFDPNKPTMIYFNGSWYDFPYEWCEKANLVEFITLPGFYEKLGDFLMVYLSSVAPNYNKAIQTFGYSLGGRCATRSSTRINTVYADRRYNINRITLHDSVANTSEVAAFLNSGVDGEQCWVDSYIAIVSQYFPGALNIRFPGGNHGTPSQWYGISLDPATYTTGDIYNNGLVAGAYLSVIGPGKNLQLASLSTIPYYFKWMGPLDVKGNMSGPGTLAFFDESSYPGRLPEPVTLVGPENGSVIDANGAVFSCEVSENAVGYQLLFGSDPYRVMDYNIISDTPNPPNEMIAELPFQQTWWTVRAYDQYGSTIYADPRLINLPENIQPVADAGPDRTIYAWLDGKASIALDGSNSSDPDGDTLTYMWAWAIDVNMYEASSVSPTIELPVGVHTIQLMVNDGYADSAPDDVNITVVAPLEGNLKITPQTISRKSNQPHIQAIIQMPDGIAMRDIDSSEPLILYPGEIKATKQSFAADDGISADFNKDALMAAVPTNGKTELKLTGKLKSGRYFCGNDKVVIISPPDKGR
jgi:hypothetical protein